MFHLPDGRHSRQHLSKTCLEGVPILQFKRQLLRRASEPARISMALLRSIWCKVEKFQVSATVCSIAGHSIRRYGMYSTTTGHSRQRRTVYHVCTHRKPNHSSMSVSSTSSPASLAFVPNSPPCCSTTSSFSPLKTRTKRRRLYGWRISFRTTKKSRLVVRT